MVEAAKDPEYTLDLFDGCFELGITSFDTGHGYAGGNSERRLGEWMERRGNRDDVVILTKGAHHNSDRQRVTPFDTASDLHDSLARLKTDRIDIYLLHRDDPSQPVGPIVDALNEHKAAGKFTILGVSNWSHQRIEEANAYAEANGLEKFTLSSPNFSLAVEAEPPWENCISIGGDAGAEAREWYAKHDMPLVLWSGLAQGFFSSRFNRDTYESYRDQLPECCDRAYCHDENFERLARAESLAAEKGLTAAQIALAYTMNQHLDLYPVIGVFNREECRANIAALEVELTPSEMGWLDLKQDER